MAYLYDKFHFTFYIYIYVCMLPSVLLFDFPFSSIYSTPQLLGFKRTDNDKMFIIEQNLFFPFTYQRNRC